MNPRESHGWIGVDLDCTLAEHTPETGVEEIGAPIPKMVERVKRWLEQGIEVRILTARVHPAWPKWAEQTDMIVDWCKRHLGKALIVTCMKDPRMLELWDDRALTVQPNTGELIHPISAFDEDD